MNVRQIIIILMILFLGFFIRIYELDKIPSGLNLDEASQGYNAYSLLLTGHDRYGQSFPVLFRSFGSFQPALYTYLTTVPIHFLGLSIFSVRIVSVLAGLVTVLLTFLFIYLFGDRGKKWLPALCAFLVAFSPWSIFFSRQAVEANLGAAIYISSIFFFVWALRHPKLLVFAFVLLGFSTHAYYAEKITSILFIGCFFTMFRKQFMSYKRYLLLGFLLFLVIIAPFVFIAGSDAMFRRVDQVNYLNESFFQQNGGNFVNFPFGKWIYALREFFSQYVAYFSPRNLFFDADPQGVRSMPGMSVFYGWMVIPFLWGLKSFFWGERSKGKNVLQKILLLMIVIAPLPAALTRDPFYTTRVLPLLWVFNVVIAYGLYDIFRVIPKIAIKYAVGISLILFSGLFLYISYFVLLKHERGDNYGYSYIKLAGNSSSYPGTPIVLDSSRQPEAYIWLAFFKKYDPTLFQRNDANKYVKQYYNNTEFSEQFNVGNIEVRQIFWKDDVYKQQILVGDDLAISSSQILEHKLNLEFEIKDINGRVKLRAYKTNPGLKKGNEKYL